MVDANRDSLGHRRPRAGLVRCLTGNRSKNFGRVHQPHEHSSLRPVIASQRVECLRSVWDLFRVRLMAVSEKVMMRICKTFAPQPPNTVLAFGRSPFVARLLRNSQAVRNGCE